jgi:hypothetical protein
MSEMPLHRLPARSDYCVFVVSSLTNCFFFGLIIGLGYVEGDHPYSRLAPPGNYFLQVISFITLSLIYFFSMAAYPSPERVARGVSPWQAAREKAKESLGHGLLLGVGFWGLITLVYFASGEQHTFIPTQMSQLDFAGYLGIVIIGTLGFNVLFFFGRYEFPEKKRRIKTQEKGE